MAARRKVLLYTMPGRTAKDDAWLALKGASYHLYQLKEQFESGLLDDNQVMLFHWHLRSFFWELVAVRDSLRRDMKAASTLETALQALDNTTWFREVNEYRNFAHQSFHIVEVARRNATNRAVAFQMQLRTGDGLSHLKDYWSEMETFFKTIYP
jgi:hypothetical protein